MRGMTRRRWLAAATALAATIAGCGGDGDDEPAISTGLQELELMRNGVAHPYLLLVPADYDPDTPVPLVVAMHGRPGTPYQIAGQSGLNEVAEEAGFLVAYPANLPDVDLVVDLLDQVTADWSVAAGGIYATGFSAGGSRSWQLAVRAGDRVAAIASVGGPHVPGEARPAAPVSALAVVGLNDRAWLDQIEAGLTAWRDQQGCLPEEPTWMDERERISRTVAGCDDGSELVEYRVDGLAHQWPGNLVPGQSTGETIWEFFAAHRRPE